jgi:ABC-type multidrug transport system ATPase subunit
VAGVIRVEGLAKRWGAVRAVDGLSFAVEPGETFALIGPNGAGKTTTLKCLLGLVRPDAGLIAVGPEGLAPDDPRARASIGWVPQRTDYPAGRTAEEVLGFFAALRGLAPSAVGAAIERVGLGEYAKRRANELSGGYAQRLSLAQALLGDPSLLVLDEPTASLDPQATWEFRSLVLDLKAQGRTILLCSHLLDEVERVADRVLILVGGKAAALQRMDDLRARQVSATRLVVSLSGAPERALAALAARGIPGSVEDGGAVAVEASDGRFLEALDVLRSGGVGVRGVEMRRPTLEEVFLAAVRGGDGGRP